MTVAAEKNTYYRAAGVFHDREALEDAIRDLKNADFDMEDVSLMARDVKDVEGAKEITEETGGNEAAEGAGAGATAGTVLGAIGGFLVGIGALIIPGIGPVVAAGEFATIGSTLAGAGIGAAGGGIVGGLVGLGIPEEKAKVYQDRVNAGDYLLMVRGTKEAVDRAGSLLGDRGIEEYGVYEAPDLDRETMETREGVGREAIDADRDNAEVIETREEHSKTTTSNDADVVVVDRRNDNVEKYNL